MYRPTEKAKKKPVHIVVRDKKGEVINKDAAIGTLPAEDNQEAYKYAYDIGLHDHVEKIEVKVDAKKK